MKNNLIALTIFCAMTVAHGQTYVSGGIYSNTTWTIVNSPYVITGNVVVFPNVTLTIQPGVVVKFANSQYLEIRQAQLIAVGTATDSITFTTNSLTPTPGLYNGIKLNGTSNLSSIFNYCTFQYADTGLYNFQLNTTAFIKNSTFRYNNYGLLFLGIEMDSTDFIYNIVGAYSMASQGSIINRCKFFHNSTGLSAYGNYLAKNCIIQYNNIGINRVCGTNVDSCIVKFNNWGIGNINEMNYTGNSIIQNSIIDSNNIVGISLSYKDTVRNCRISYNATGIDDSVHIPFGGLNVIQQNLIINNGYGMVLLYSNDEVSCNSICNNSNYGLYYLATQNATIPNNYWCTADSASTEAVIYDGYDNISYGLVFYMPLDSLCSPNNPTYINVITRKPSYQIFPNPFYSQTVLQTNHPLKNATLTVDNCFGQKVKQINNISGQTVTLYRDNLSSGLYFLYLTEDNKILLVDKIVIADK